MGNQLAGNRLTSTQQQKGGTWYFYNPMTVNQGKAAFQKQWGKRENVDNWQRINQTVVNLAAGEQPADSLAANTEGGMAATDGAPPPMALRPTLPPTTRTHGNTTWRKYRLQKSRKPRATT